MCVNEKDGISVIGKQGRKYNSLNVLCTALNMSFQSNVIFGVIEMPGKGTLPFLDRSVVPKPA